MIDLEATTSYSVKIINPSKKSDYFIRKWRTRIRFQNVQCLQEKLRKELDGLDKTFEMGYIEPGHGARGKQCWILSDDDLDDMYEAYSGKKEIMLWVYARSGETSGESGRKRPRSPLPSGDHEKAQKSRKSDSHAKKLMEVEEIADDLVLRHGGLYTREQYSVWAHMINMQKHESRDVAPDKPFFKGSKGKKKLATSDPSTSTSEPLEISPGKRIHLRTQCMDQLEKWHCLLEKGVISEEQYSELQGNILGDIKKF